MLHRTCSIEGCARPHQARGLCARCYGRANYHQLIPHAPRGVGSCVVCSRPLHGEQQLVCSSRCQAWRARHKDMIGPSRIRRYCLRCGIGIDYRDIRSKHCSSLCRDRDYAKVGTGTEMSCLQCDKLFIKSKKSHKCCSASCAKRWDLQQNYESYLKRGQERRARERDGLTNERFTRLEIFERDGWVCHLCNRPTDPTKSMRHRDMPSIDHVIPLKFGGKHTRDNVRCAHFGCNAAKGARYGWTRASS
jgi:hypothetical protein